MHLQRTGFMDTIKTIQKQQQQTHNKTNKIDRQFQSYIGLVWCEAEKKKKKIKC